MLYGPEQMQHGSAAVAVGAEFFFRTAVALLDSFPSEVQ